MDDCQHLRLVKGIQTHIIPTIPMYGHNHSSGQVTYSCEECKKHMFTKERFISRCPVSDCDWGKKEENQYLERFYSGNLEDFMPWMI